MPGDHFLSIGTPAAPGDGFVPLGSGCALIPVMALAVAGSSTTDGFFDH
ncbi:hypothetical protein [Kribbella sp. VKM Ac-2500]|nr:hypothetical protein [Kribbella sp. VKM Ac-2500]